MYLSIVALHVMLCLFMILIILLQPSKGEVGLAFGGGGSSTVFGPRGPASLLQRATTVVAVMFMGTSIALALYSKPEARANSNMESHAADVQKDLAEKAKKNAEEAKEVPVEE